MRLAVFTSQYPARTATFFERDMRSLLARNVGIDVFAVHPLDESLWRYSLGLLDDGRVTRHRIHHLTFGESLLRAGPVLRRSAPWLGDAAAVLASAARFGPIPLAKTAYVLPKAWAWAAESARSYDHVMAYWGNYAGTCAWAFHRLLGEDIPFSIWLHAGVDLYRTRVFLRQKLRYADSIVTCCEFNADFMREHFPEDAAEIAAKLHVCHHGLDLTEFPFRPGERPAHHVVAVGRLAMHKGFDYLLWAAHILYSRGEEMTLEFVGDGPERGMLQALARDLGIADRVTFRGWLTFPEARQAMSQATVLVHPSDGLGDGLPNVVREAMALGTPVIASSVAGLPGALGDGRGVLVPARDSTALADAIAALLADPARQRALADRARQHVEAHYNLFTNGARLAGRLKAARRRPRPETRSWPMPHAPQAIR